jgi:hypothetical protein
VPKRQKRKAERFRDVPMVSVHVPMVSVHVPMVSIHVPMVSNEAATRRKLHGKSARP